MKQKQALAIGAVGLLVVCGVGYVIANNQAIPEDTQTVTHSLESTQSIQEATTHQDKMQQYQAIADAIANNREPIIVGKVFRDGYLQKHGDHYHYIKGPVPKNAIYEEELKGTTDSHAHDGYVFRWEDVVEENDLGYVVRHGDHFHFIFKNQVAQLTGTDTHDTHFVAAPHEEEAPFVFDARHIISETDHGYIVQHGDHTHYVPKDTVTPPSAQSVLEQPQTSDAARKRQEKIDAIIKKYQFDPATIIVDGDYLLYPHGDHYHSISLLDETLPEDPYAHDHNHDHAHAGERIGMNTLEKMGLHPELVHSLVHAGTHDDSPFPGTETDPEKMRAYLAKVSSINVGQIDKPFSMSGFEYLTNLETLAAGFTPITNQELAAAFERYPHLKNVKRLWLTETGITDYQFTRAMPNLIGLDISSNKVTDLSFLKDISLTELAVANSGLTDVSFLSGTRITNLNLDYNELSDLSPLQSLPLQVLSVENNRLSSAAGLSGNTTLSRLYIGNTAEQARTIDLSQTQLPALTELTANHIGLQSLTDLSHFAHLTSADVAHNQLHNLDGLAALPTLETLSVAHNQLTDLAGLTQTQSVRSIDASHNQLTTLQLEGTNDSVERLTVSHNAIERLDGIGSYKRLDRLVIDHNALTSFEAKDPSLSMTFINAEHNQLRSWDGFLDHPKFEEGYVFNGNEALPPFPFGNEQAKEETATHHETAADQSADHTPTAQETAAQHVEKVDSDADIRESDATELVEPSHNDPNGVTP